LARVYRSFIGGPFEDLEFSLPAPFVDLPQVDEAGFHPDGHLVGTGLVAIMSDGKLPIFKARTGIKSDAILDP
jgi:hypothetical protein